MHFRQERLFNIHFNEINAESFTHKFKGIDYTVHQDHLEHLPPDLLQSITTRLSKMYPPPQGGGGGGNGKPDEGDPEDSQESGNQEGEGQPGPGEGEPQEGSPQEGESQEGEGSGDGEPSEMEAMDEGEPTDKPGTLDPKDDFQQAKEVEEEFKRRIPEERKGDPKEEGGYGVGQNHQKNSDILRRELIRSELLRISLVESIVEEKLDYPRVFKRLLTEPHLALYERKKTLETKQDLYLFIDSSIGYNSKDKGFHNTMYQEALKIKGITVFYQGMLRDESGKYYWQQLPKIVPKGKKILVFSQGCGGVMGKFPKGYDVTFVTHFKPGCNCGCDAIKKHENVLNPSKILYGIDVPEKLKLVKVY